MTDFRMFVRAIIFVFLFQSFVYSQPVCNFFRKLSVTYSLSSDDGQLQRSRLLCAENCARDCLCLGFQYHKEGSQLFPKRTCVLLKLDKYKHPNLDAQLVTAYIVIADYSKQKLPCAFASNDSCSERRSVSNALVANLKKAKLVFSSVAPLSVSDPIIEASSTISNSDSDAYIQTAYFEDSTSSFAAVYENHKGSIQSAFLSTSVVQNDIDIRTSFTISDTYLSTTTKTNANDTYRTTSQKVNSDIPSNVGSSADAVSTMFGSIYQGVSSDVIMTTFKSKYSTSGYTSQTFLIHNAHVSSALNPTSVSDALSMNKEYTSKTPKTSPETLKDNDQVIVSSSYSDLASVQELFVHSLHNTKNTELSDFSFQIISVVKGTAITFDQKESKVDSDSLFNTFTWNSLAASPLSADLKQLKNEIPRSYFLFSADTSTELALTFLTTDTDSEISKIDYYQITSSKHTESEVANNIISSLLGTPDRIGNVDSEETSLSIDYISKLENFQNSMSSRTTLELFDLILSHSELSEESGITSDLSSAKNGGYSSATSALSAVIMTNSLLSQDRISQLDTEEILPDSEVLSLMGSATYSLDLTHTIMTQNSMTTLSPSLSPSLLPIPSLYLSLSSFVILSPKSSSILSSPIPSSLVISTTISMMQVSFSTTSHLTHLKGEMNSISSLTNSWKVPIQTNIISDTSPTDELQTKGNQSTSFIENKFQSISYRSDITAYPSNVFNSLLTPGLSIDTSPEILSSTKSLSDVSLVKSSVAPSNSGNSVFDSAIQSSPLLTDSFTKISSGIILRESIFKSSSTINVISETLVHIASNIATDVDVVSENLHSTFEISKDNILSDYVSSEVTTDAFISISSTNDALNFITVLTTENSVTSLSPLPLQSALPLLSSSLSASFLSLFHSSHSAYFINISTLSASWLEASSSSLLMSSSNLSFYSNLSSYPLSTSYLEQPLFSSTTSIPSPATLSNPKSINSNTIVESSMPFYSDFVDQTIVSNVVVNALHTVSSTFDAEREHGSSTTYVSSVFVSQFLASLTTIYSDVKIENTNTDTLSADTSFSDDLSSDRAEVLLTSEYVTSYVQSSQPPSTLMSVSGQEFTSILSQNSIITSATSPLIAALMLNHTSFSSQPMEGTSKIQDVLNISSITSTVSFTISSTFLLNSVSGISENLESISVSSHITSLTYKSNEINATSSKSLLNISSLESLDSESTIYQVFSSATPMQYHTTNHGPATTSVLSIQPSFESSFSVILPQTQSSVSPSSVPPSTIRYVINSSCIIDACLVHESLHQIWMFSGERVYTYENSCEGPGLTDPIENRTISDIFRNESLVGPINGAFFSNDEINLIKGTFIFTFNASTIDTEPATKHSIQNVFGVSFPSFPDAVTADDTSIYFIKDGMLHSKSNDSTTMKEKQNLQGVTATCHLCNNSFLAIIGQDMFIIDSRNDTKIEVGKIYC